MHVHSFVPNDAKGYLLVAPMRDPREVVRSWQRRGRYSLQKLVSQFKLLSKYRDGTFVLPIDIPERDTYLAHLSTLLDRDLRTTWERVGHAESPSAPAYFGEDPEEYVERIYDVAPWLADFYG